MEANDLTLIFCFGEHWPIEIYLDWYYLQINIKCVKKKLQRQTICGIYHDPFWCMANMYVKRIVEKAPHYLSCTKKVKNATMWKYPFHQKQSYKKVAQSQTEHTIANSVKNRAEKQCQIVCVVLFDFFLVYD